MDNYCHITTFKNSSLLRIITFCYRSCVFKNTYRSHAPENWMRLIILGALLQSHVAMQTAFFRFFTFPPLKT